MFERLARIVGGGAGRGSGEALDLSPPSAPWIFAHAILRDWAFSLAAPPSAHEARRTLQEALHGLDPEAGRIGCARFRLGEREALLVEPPEPTRPGECVAAAVLFGEGGAERYFTYELAQGGGRAVLCEWTKGGPRIAHGARGAPTWRAFVGILERSA